MGIKVSAYEASQLVDRHERIVRGRIARGDLPSAVKEGNTWRIDVDDLERIPAWTVNRDRLAALEAERRAHEEAKTVAGMAVRLAELEREVRALHERVQALEAERLRGHGGHGGHTGHETR